MVRNIRFTNADNTVELVSEHRFLSIWGQELKAAIARFKAAFPKTQIAVIEYY